MFRRIIQTGLILTFLTAVTHAGAVGGELKVLPPISHGNLTIFPIVGAGTNDYAHLLTLDEGLRLGSVTVTENGSVQPLVRGHARPRPSGSAEVNRLVLINDSDRPLLLLAGEIVTGGKQDRVIGADRIIPAHSGPVDLSVFCVEPGRWVASSNNFDTTKSVAMAQPSVRNSAMNDRSQQKVWDNVNESHKQVSETVAVNAAAAPSPGTSGGGGGGGGRGVGMGGGIGAGHSGGVSGGTLQTIESTTSYAKVMAVPEVQEQIKAYVGDYDAALRELKKAGARGVVVAVNGRILWADIFSSTELLEKYWQKLVRSYAAEAYTAHAKATPADIGAAQRFVDQLAGNHEVVETEPGVYRRSEVTGEGFKVFTITSLLPKSEQTVHIAKMAYAGTPSAAIGQMIR
jgi:hypothetical protein